MDATWSEILIIAAQTLAALVTGIGIPYLLYLMKKKVATEENLAAKELIDKIIDKAGEIAGDCVLMVQQTFVDNLKKEGKFDAAAQAEAFTLCKDEILKLLSSEAKQAIIDTFGSLNDWIKTKIEADVWLNKAVPLP